MKIYLKEKLNTQRTNKTLLWQTLLLTIASTLGLLIKAFNSGTNLFELLLIALGIAGVFVLLKLITNLTANIVFLQNELLKEEVKNATNISDK